MKNMPKRLSSRIVILLTALTLIGVCAVGYTVAWLSDIHKLETVVFSDSDIKIVFEDQKSAESVKMVPGHTADKAPTVTVKADSEKCYLFVKVEKSIGVNGEILIDGEENEIAYFDDFIVYSVDVAKDGEPETENGWLLLTDKDGKVVEDVYYRIVDESDSDQKFQVLKGGKYEMDGLVYTWGEDQILINPEISLEMQSALNGDNSPKLSFSAYAIQYFKSNDEPFEAYEAWTMVSA